MEQELIPLNEEGKSSDLGFSMTADTVDAARYRYMKAVKRMLNPSEWHKLAGWASASFAVISDSEEVRSRLAQEGDYIRIDVPGPGPKAGRGYDWVRVEKIEEYTESSEQKEWTGLKVRPSIMPGSGSADAAQFFRHEASSTFVIERDGEKISAFYYGRNEISNTHTSSPVDNLRNGAVAAGAAARLSEAQWSALCKGFLMA